MLCITLGDDLGIIIIIKINNNKTDRIHILLYFIKFWFGRRKR